MKRCTKCGKKKSLSEFSTNGVGKPGVKPSCKECNARRQDAVRQARRARKRIRIPQQKKCSGCGLTKLCDQFHPNRAMLDGLHNNCLWCERSRKLKKTYGIDLNVVQELLIEQGGICQICRKPLDLSTAQVDHCHRANKVRGLLCRSCNTGLGLFCDSVDNLRSAIDYLHLSAPEEKDSEVPVGKDMKKKCKKCGSEKLLCKVTIEKMVPLADRNGTIKVGGQKIGQMDLKFAWDTIGGIESSPEQKIRGPIQCEDCETEHFFVVGDSNPLRVGSTAEARELGYDALYTKG